METIFQRNLSYHTNLGKILLLFGFCLVTSTGCINDKGNFNDPIAESNYPEAVGKIIVNKCATSGCHNTKSKEGASGLDLSTWDKAFDGNNSGAVIVPFAPEHSTLLNFTNTDSTIGIVQIPTMPINGQPLSKTEYQTLKNWILSGAPDKNGNVFFQNATSKYYVSNQGCDLVAVCDPNRQVIARYIKVGISDGSTELPHIIKPAPDGKHWYAIFYGGSVFQKFRTADDLLVASVNIPSGGWSGLTFTSDSKKAFLSTLTNHAIIEIDLDQMQQIGPFYNVYQNAHGMAINPKNGWLYVTNQYSNYINKVSLNDLASPNCFPMFPNAPCADINSYNPHEIVFSPDSSRYFVTCEFSNEVRVFYADNDSLMATIPVGTLPKEMSLSLSKPYLFITCPETPNTLSSYRGSVVVINYLTNQVITEIKNAFFQPHGIAVNDDKGVVYVSSRNADPNGPAPHHVSECGGRNGFLSIINLNTLTVLPNYKNEMSVDPYSVFYIK
jgi:DNA-binding beta-propeller fold protein YncE